MATALMAIARKVIILDMKDLTPMYLMGLAAVVLAMSLGYWLVVVGPGGTTHGDTADLEDTGDSDSNCGSKMPSAD